MFENLADAKKQILRDKHSLLEGYVTEHLYQQQFLVAGKGRYTSGWWTAQAGGQRFFFVVTDAMNEVDKQVAALLTAHKYPVWQAYPEGDTWYFHCGDAKLTLAEFQANYHLRPSPYAASASADTRVYARQLKCLNFFEAHGLLQKIAIERYFADTILTGSFQSLVNLDYIVQRDDGQLSVAEVKFKNRSRNGKFGMNVGQFHTFELLETLGFEIHHAILDKGVHNNKFVSIFDFLEQTGEKNWLIGQIETGKIRQRSKTAPRETSVSGNRVQPYFEIDASRFQTIKLSCGNLGTSV